MRKPVIGSNEQQTIANLKNQVESGANPEEARDGALQVSRYTKPKKKIIKHFDHHKTGYKGKDSRTGRIHNVTTDRGDFRFKDNKKGD